MSEQENFLTRWSRRKLDAEEEAAPAAESAPQKTAANGEAERPDIVEDEKAPAPAFDPASLPSIDSIGAQTDITAFLKAGVPGDLRLAALRRAWVTDPAIRDFKGLAENDWDFTVPNEAMGFGPIDPGLDTKKMLADVFGETPRPAAPAQEAGQVDEKAVPAPNESHAREEQASLESLDASRSVGEIVSDEDLVQRNNGVAMQSKEDGPDEAPVPRRRPQGGALPQ